MRPYQIRKRSDGRWEALAHGATRALFVFDSAEDVAAFASALGAHGPSAPPPGEDAISESLPSHARTVKGTH